MTIDVSFPVAQEDIIPTWKYINEEMRRLEDKIQQLKILRSRVILECGHPDSFWCRTNRNDDIITARKCTTCLKILEESDEDE